MCYENSVTEFSEVYNPTCSKMLSYNKMRDYGPNVIIPLTEIRHA